MPVEIETFTGMITLLEFSAAWCGPCKILTPVLSSLEAGYAGKVALQVVDVDDAPELAQRYGVRSVPTVVLLREDREVGRVVGARPRAFIAGMVDRALAGDVAIACP